MSKLKSERLKRGWSQQTLAYHAQMSASDVSRIENGRLVPYEGQANRLASVVGIPPEDLQKPAVTSADQVPA